MRKDILLSLLAVGAVPTGAIAADVPGVSIQTLTGTGASLNDDKTVLTSTGATLTQTVELVKGKYTVKATTTADIYVDGTKTTTFELAETKTVTIEFKSKDGQAFTVTGLTLAAEFDFKAAKAELSALIVTVTAKGTTAAAAGDETAAGIVRELGKIQADVDKWVDTYEYYKDWVNQTTYNKIKDFENQLDGASANYDCMVYARNEFQTILDALNTYKTGDFAAATDYAKGKYTGTLNSLIAEVEALLTAVENSYKSGKAASDYTKTIVDEKVAGYTAVKGGDVKKDGTFTDLKNKVIAANNDDAAWTSITNTRTAAQNAYLNAYKELNEKLNNDADKEVYGDWFADATKTLSAQYQIIITAEGNLNDENHDGAAGKQTAVEKAINDAKTAITTAKTKYITDYNTQKAAYAAACNLVSTKTVATSLQAQLNAINNPDVKAKYAAKINELQSKIDAVQAKIDADNKKHEIVGKDYSADVKTVQNAIDAFKNDNAVKKTIDNYNANEDGKGKIAELKTALQEAKDAVVEAAVTDADENVVYDADAHYTTTYNNLNKAIATYETDLAAAYGKETAQTYMSTGNGKNMGSTKTAIGTYQSDAETSAAKYKTITTAIASYQTALDALKEKAEDTTAEVQNMTGNPSYGEVIENMQQEINTLQSNLNKAVGTKDADHTKAMKALAVISDFVSRAEALVGSYETDKAQWDKDEAGRAWNVMYSQANSRVTALLANSFFADDYKGEDLGNSWNAANDCETNISSEIKTLKARIEAQQEKLEGLNENNGGPGKVYEVNLALDEIATDVAKLEEKINDIKEAVKANADAYTELISKFTTSQHKSTEIDEQLKKSNAPYKDWNDDGKDKFDKSRTALEETRDGIKSRIENGKKYETLVNDRKDVMNEDGTVKTKGIDSSIADLNADIATATTAAQSAHNNLVAYNNFMNKDGGSINKYEKSGNSYISVAKIIENTENTVKGLKQGTGENYFLNVVLKGYKTDLATLTTAIYNDYAIDSVSATNPTKGFGDISSLVTKVKKAGTDAKDNRTYYDNQVKQYKATYAAYVEANKEIMAHEYVAEKDNALAELGAYLNDILAYGTEAGGNIADGKIGTAFAAGKAHTDGKDYANELLAIKTAIDGIKAKFNAGYNEYIAADNKVVYDNFLLALAESTKALSEATNKLEQYKNIKNEAGSTAVAEVLAAYEGIYAYADEIFNLNATVAEEYTTADANHEFFDREETHKQEAQDITEAIKKAQDEFAKKVNDKAWELYQARYNAAVVELAYNKAQIAGTGKFKTVLDQQFKSSTKLLDGIKTKYDANKANDFALWLDETDGNGVSNYEQLNGISEIIAGELVDAYSAIITSLDAQIAREYNDICNVFAYVDADTRNGYINQYRLQVYDDRYTSPYGHAKENAEEAENLLDVISDVVDQLETVKGNIDSIYDNAKKADARQGENKTAYDEMLAENGPLDKLQKALDAVEAWAKPFVVIDGYATGVANVQTEINNWKAEVENNFRDGTAKTYQADNKTTWENKLKVLEGNDRLTSEKHSAIIAERTELAKRIQTLQGAYAKAVDAVGAVDDNQVLADYLETQKAEIDALVAKLKTVQEEYESKDSRGNRIYFTNDQMKTKCVEMEAKIAELHTTLAQTYDAGLQQSLLDALNATLTADAKDIVAKAKNQITGLHTPVQNTYSSDISKLNQAIIEAEDLIKDIDTEIAKYTAANSVILYNDIIEDHIKTVVEAIKNADIKATAQSLAYTDDTNETLHNNLTGRISDAKDRLDAVMATINAYESVVERVKDWSDDEYDLRYWYYSSNSIEELEYWVGQYYNNVTLSSRNTLLTNNCNSLDSNIENLLKNATYAEDGYQIGKSRTTLDAILIAEATSTEGRLGRRYFDGALKKLMNEDSAIGNKLTAATTYSYNVNNGSTNVDVNGNTIYRENWYAYDYVTVAHPAIVDALVALNNRIAQLEEDAENSYYYIGSADGDDIVDVNDYTTVLNHLAGKNVIKNPADVEEPTTMDLKMFYGADVNGDKAIRIGDLTAIAQIVNGVYNRDNNFSNITNKAPQRNAETPALQISTSDNGTTQRLAIRLTGSKTFSACQMDIMLPNGVTVASKSLGEGASDHSVMSNILENGAYRVIVSSMSADALGSEDFLYVDLNVSSSYAGENIEITNIFASDMNCNTVEIAAVTVNGDEATGIHTVSTMEDVKNRIYNLGGRMMDGFKKGINIIVGEDGTTKKVVR